MQTIAIALLWALVALIATCVIMLILTILTVMCFAVLRTLYEETGSMGPLTLIVFIALSAITIFCRI